MNNLFKALLITSVMSFGSIAMAQEPLFEGNKTENSLEWLQNGLGDIPNSRLSTNDFQSVRIGGREYRKMMENRGFGFGETPPFVDVEFVRKSTFVLFFKDGLTVQDLKELAETNNFDYVETFPNLNSALVVSNAESNQNNFDSNTSLLRAIVSTSQQLSEDNRIIAAAPDTILASQNVRVKPLELTNIRDTDVEIRDWGIENIDAHTIWNDPRSSDGAILGVLDTGFGKHEDLTFLGWPATNSRSNHGNHVAGIACAKHNGIGVQGVLKNCFVQATSGVFFGYPDDGSFGDFFDFYLLFSQTIREFNRILDNPGGAKVFNLSLGYNWIPNFGINPDDPSNTEYRALVVAQGEGLVQTLSRIAGADIVVYSASGNDSSRLLDPIDAKFASPFNWAAIVARERGVAYNGVVVEAHDRNGDRANFSNEKGHISCPGVNIMSTVAYDNASKPSFTSYGTMSGTSMASPYCASGHLLFSLIRPNYNNTEIVDCLLNSEQTSSSGTPMLKLEKARSHCPPR